MEDSIMIKRKLKIKKLNRITLVIILSAIFTHSVFALENKIYFTNSGDRLYYDTQSFDENVFLQHLDMIPGSSYTDTLNIENHTKYTYKLYMKIKEVEGQSEEAEELLDNIKMKIYHDGALIYDGYAKGLDYNESGTNLQNAIYIGEYTPDKESKLLVDTELLTTYSNTENQEYSYIDWEFYAEYEELVIPINPDTGGEIFNQNNVIRNIVITLTFILLLILVVLLFIEKNKQERIE